MQELALAVKQQKGAENPLLLLFTINFNGLCGKFRCAGSAGFVDVIFEPFVADIHFSKTGKNFIGAGVIIPSDEILKFLDERLGFGRIRRKIFYFSDSLENILPLGAVAEICSSYLHSHDFKWVYELQPSDLEERTIIQNNLEFTGDKL